MSMASSKTKVVTASQNTQHNELTIRARAAEDEKPPVERRPRVKFTDDTVDNEGMGRKSSKGTFDLNSSLYLKCVRSLKKKFYLAYKSVFVLLSKF